MTVVTLPATRDVRVRMSEDLDEEVSVIRDHLVANFHPSTVSHALRYAIRHTAATIRGNAPELPNREGT